MMFLVLPLLASLQFHAHHLRNINTLIHLKLLESDPDVCLNVPSGARDVWSH